MTIFHGGGAPACRARSTNQAPKPNVHLRRGHDVALRHRTDRRRPDDDDQQGRRSQGEPAPTTRVVMASSNHAADWYEDLLHVGKMDVVDPERTPNKSDNYYGWAKIAYEALGFVYACGAFGRKLEVVQIRIGAPREIDAARFEGRPAEYKRDLGAFISQRDLQQLFVRSLECGPLEDQWGVPFQIFYGVSNNTRAFWSIANARHIIGYHPEDDSELRYATDIARRLATSPGSLGPTGN